MDVVELLPSPTLTSEQREQLLGLFQPELSRAHAERLVDDVARHYERNYPRILQRLAESESVARLAKDLSV